MIILTICSHSKGRVIYCKKKLSVDDAKDFMNRVVAPNKIESQRKIVWIKNPHEHEEHCMFVADGLSSSDVFMAQIFTL